jgi:hypothetical protein
MQSWVIGWELQKDFADAFIASPSRKYSASCQPKLPAVGFVSF